MKKQDLVNIAVLSAIGLGVGIYLIATTVLISGDGVHYIGLAKAFAEDPVGVMRRDFFGYPVLICITHKLYSLVCDGSSLTSWIYSGQIASLLCRILNIIPLYYIGKMLVGAKRSLWALVILLVLPYPARMGADVLRCWPHMLCLATGFWLLLWGARRAKWWAFGLAGLSAGFGNLFRLESIQLVIYGVLWLFLSMFSKRRTISRPQLLRALALLVVGFAIPVAIYLTVLGFKPPAVREGFIGAYGFTEATETAVILAAWRELTTTLAESLMYFFVPAWLVGIYYHLRTKAEFYEKFFIIAFLLLNSVMLTWLYCNSGFIARRHSLPLVALTIFYVPVGIQGIGNWLDKRLPVHKRKTGDMRQTSFSWYLILLTVGIVVCLPKLATPIRVKKKAYRDVAQWLRENTDTDAVIAVPDDRISFYAGRKGICYEQHEIPEDADFVVKEVRTDKDMPKAERLYAVEDKSKKYKFVIYKPGT